MKLLQGGVEDLLFEWDGVGHQLGVQQLREDSRGHSFEILVCFRQWSTELVECVSNVQDHVVTNHQLS